MVSVVLLSHSAKIVEGVRELVAQMTQDAKIFVCGGTADGELGSDFEGIKGTLEEAFSPDGVLIFFDLGSTYMTAEAVLEDENFSMDAAKYHIVDAPLVEGACEAAVLAGINLGLDSIFEELEKLKIGKI